MAKEDPYFRLRVPETLKARIEKSAAENNRSMTAEIISRLESSYDYEKDGEWTQEAISDHERRLDKVEALLAELERLVIPGRY